MLIVSVVGEEEGLRGDDFFIGIKDEEEEDEEHGAEVDNSKEDNGFEEDDEINGPLPHELARGRFATRRLALKCSASSSSSRPSLIASYKKAKEATAQEKKRIRLFKHLLLLINL